MFLQRTIGHVKISVARLKPNSRTSSPRASIESSSLYSFPTAVTARNVNLPASPSSPLDPERYQPVLGPPPSYGMCRSYYISVQAQFSCLPIGQNRITCRSTCEGATGQQ
jgi:hypothetical protein